MKKCFPFYYENYIAGTAFLSRREKGAYLDLLCSQADKGHLTLQNIKDILNGDFDCWEKIKSKFIEENGLYYNVKLESVKKGKHKRTQEEIAIDWARNQEIIKQKKQIFYENCKPYLEKYPKEMLRAFYNYWTEMNKSGTKIKYEMQQTFEIGKRLATWAGKDKEFINQQPKTYQQMLELTKNNPELWNQYKSVKSDGKAVFVPK